MEDGGINFLSFLPSLEFSEQCDSHSAPKEVTSG